MFTAEEIKAQRIRIAKQWASQLEAYKQEVKTTHSQLQLMLDDVSMCPHDSGLRHRLIEQYRSLYALACARLELSKYCAERLK